MGPANVGRSGRSLGKRLRLGRCWRTCRFCLWYRRTALALLPALRGGVSSRRATWPMPFNLVDRFFSGGVERPTSYLQRAPGCF
jgi:hypothetical protein